MILLRTQSAPRHRIRADVSVIFIAEDKQLFGRQAGFLRKAIGADASPLDTAAFTGKSRQTLLLYPRALGAAQLLLVGTGLLEQCSLETLRRAAATAAKTANGLKAKTLALLEPDEQIVASAAGETEDDALSLAGSALAEGAALGLYQFVFRAGPAGFLLFDGRFLRAYGSFRQPNPYAGYLGLVLPIAYSLLLWGLGSSSQRSAVSRQRSAISGQPSASSPTPYSPLLSPYFTLPAFGLMLAALYASQSRGAWIGFAAALVAVSLARGGRSAVIFGMVVAVVATAGALGDVSLPPTITERFADVLPMAGVPDIATVQVTDANFAAVERLAHWQAALAMWRDHPWLGVGFGNYAAIYPAYAIGRWLDPLGHAHNYYLNVGAEAGLVGLLGYIFFWLSAFGLAWQAIRRSEGFQRALAAGGLGVLVHLSVHNGLDNLFVQGMYLHVSIVLGLLALIYRAQIDNSRRQA